MSQQESTKLEGLPSWAGELLQRTDVVEEKLAVLQSQLDTDGDGRVDMAAAAPRLRALVIIAIGVMVLAGYQMTPVEQRVLRDLLVTLVILAAFGIGEAAIVARFLTNKKAA